jgi:hypothetical protein
MIVVHSVKISTLYPRVVISSLAKRLYKSPFCHSYTSFGVWPRDHYMPLQRPTTGVCHALLWFFTHSGLACSAEVSRTQWTLLHHVVQAVHTDRSHPHSTEHDTQHIACLISKQVVPYQTRGDTCCPVVSAPKIRSLADSSMTSHIT